MHLALVSLLEVLITVLVAAVIYFKWAFGYWKRRNVPYVEPRVPFGNLQNPFARKHGLYKDLADVYSELKARGCKHGGMFLASSPTYVPVDLEYVKNVLTRDFHHFVNHGIYYNERDDPLSANLFSFEDEKWKNMRAKLTPTFTSGKMKMMLHTMKNCSVPLLEEIERMNERNEALDIKELVARFTTDIIGSCAFGVECNSFREPDAEFRRYGKKAFHINFVKKLKMFLMFSLPNIARMVRMTRTKPEVSKFFLGMVKDTVQHREASNTTRPDFMQLLIDMKDLTINEISAQAYLFFLAGFETSSTTINFCFYELALNQTIQDKLRKEIVAVLAKHDGDITYEAIQEMKYLGHVVDETLRKYPAVSIIMRICSKTYQVPGTDVVIEKGTPTWVPNYGIQHDPEYFPEPEKFIPERFDDENKHKIVPFTFLGFGEGPRNCIGFRFGLMQTKIGLVSILKKFRLTLNERTPKQIHLDSSTFILTTKETIYLDSERIK